MQGYDPDFLGMHLPLPSFSIALEPQILKHEPDLRDGMIADYIHYSVIMNEDINKRSPVFAALNIDRGRFRKTNRGNNWEIDDRIGFENQLNNDYYRNNPWDRGHMARRTTTAWGTTQQEAQRADDATFFYSNSCLQHANLNQDEWLALEDWVFNLNLALDDKIVSFSGPIYGDFDRSITPSGRELALIPSGFFKLVAFRNKNTDALDVRAFMIFQDDETLKDKSGRKRFTNQTYQVSVSEIEQQTGLQFDDSIYEANPLFFSRGETPDDGSTLKSEAMNVRNFPEAEEISHGNDIINPDTVRQTVNDDIVDIFIASAMVNPEGSDHGSEWVSLINLGDVPIDITDWKLMDNHGSMTIGPANLSQTPQGNPVIEPGIAVTVRLDNTVKLSNSGDVIKLYDQNSNRIDRVTYQKRMVKRGKPVVFLTPRDTLN
jgi:endonuclease G